jgi:hypothetical protein
MADTVGSRMLSDQVWVVDTARAPLESTELFSAKQETRWPPNPATGIWALDPTCHWYREPSVEQSMPATPLAPGVAVAVTEWVPDVASASVGPERLTATGLLSTRTGLFPGPREAELLTAAALFAAYVSDNAPLAYFVVLICASSCEP